MISQPATRVLQPAELFEQLPIQGGLQPVAALGAAQVNFPCRGLLLVGLSWRDTG